MKGRSKTAFVFSLIIVISLTSILAAACSKERPAIVPPFVPPNYYECLEVEPQTLIDTYFVAYADFMTIQTLYNDLYFVFKNVTLQEWMLQNLDDGFLWVDRIRCYLVNPEDLNQYKIGDKIDVVGRNDGPTSYERAELVFKECLVLPAGAVALPKDPDAGSITPGY